MEISVKQEITVIIGGTKLKVTKEEAYELYNGLKEVLGITDYVAPYVAPYVYPLSPMPGTTEWTSASTDDGPSLDELLSDRT